MNVIARTVNPALVLVAVTALGGCPVTGQIGTWTASGNQSESVVNAATFSDGSYKVVVMYNDSTTNLSDSNKNTYTQSTHTICPGASLFGWSFFQKGDWQWTQLHKVIPSTSPMGAYWGDPAMAMQPNNANNVFMTQLGLHKTDFPNNGAGCITNDAANINMKTSGAVVYRSQLSGTSFTTASETILTNNHHFYDGSSLAADNTGAFYAAYNDLATGMIDVWKAATFSSAFTKMPDSGLVAPAHPRLAVDKSNNSTLYLMSRVAGGALKVTRFVNGAWQTPVTVATGVTYLGYALSLATTAGQPGSLVIGPQYSFDVANNELRFTYTKYDSTAKVLRVYGGWCSTDTSTISGCATAVHWSPHLNPGAADSPGDQFNPLIAYGGGKWITSWTSREEHPTGNQVSIWSGELKVGSSLTMTKSRWASDLVVCSDLGGYWGDYDQLAYMGQDSSGLHFLRPYSDSSNGCNSRWEFTADSIHVSLATLTY